jgi:hypothetical protein
MHGFYGQPQYGQQQYGQQQQYGHVPSQEEMELLHALGHPAAAQFAPQRSPEVGFWQIGEATGRPYWPEVGYYDIGAGAGSLASMGPALQQQQAFGPMPMTSWYPSGASMPGRPTGPGGLRLTDKVPQTDRVLWVGFRSAAAIGAGANANVNTQPQDTFSPRKVVVPATVAPNFEIQDLRIGNISQFSSIDPVPAEAFIPDSVATDVRMDTAQISQQINFNVNNISAAAATFRACMNGFVVRL